MPDWFYRTVSRPVLFQLSPTASRDVAIGFMGRLAALPFQIGSKAIDLLGHMRPDPRLQFSKDEFRFSSRVGLGLALDPQGRAVRAWSRFGFGFIEVGPVAVDRESLDAEQLRRCPAEESIWVSDRGGAGDAAALAARLSRVKGEKPVFIVRLSVAANSSPSDTAKALVSLASRFSGVAGVFSFELRQSRAWSHPDWKEFWSNLRVDGTARSMKWLVVVRADDSFLEAQVAAGAGLGDGLMVDGSVVDGAGRLHGKPSQRAALECVRNLRRLVGGDALIIASGGIHQPADVVQFLDAGATLLQIDTGLVFSGPGLCKRINEALLWRDAAPLSCPVPDCSLRPPEYSWFWTALLGLAMLIGSVLALIIASGRVVLPYDEAFCGWTREQMQQFNPRLLSFLAHDRVTLAGTMISIGVLYLSLSWHGVRRGLHWARMSVLLSAGAGFFSFFLFLGFGYFDPFHGFVTAVLFQLFAMGVHAREMPRGRFELPEWNETRAWRWGQWGQLLLILHSVGLLGAGILIASIGVRDVLVAEDLNYLRTTLDSLRVANPKVIPLVAHDRATLGGMLIAAGLIYLLASLWGLRRGAAWLWHSFLWSGLAAYAAAIGVHYVVGYVNLRHLLPAFAGLSLLLCGLVCARAWCLNAEDAEKGKCLE